MQYCQVNDIKNSLNDLQKLPYMALQESEAEICHGVYYKFMFLNFTL